MALLLHVGGVTGTKTSGRAPSSFCSCVFSCKGEGSSLGVASSSSSSQSVEEVRAGLWGRLVRDGARRLVRGPLARAAMAPLVALDPFHTQFAPVEPARRWMTHLRSLAPQQVEALVVMTWNIKFAGGRVDFFFDGHGDRVLMEEREVIGHLEGLADKIRRVDPDLLLLQEIDVASDRSAGVDQMQWLLDHTALNFGAYASAWRSRHVPTEGLGAVDSGNAVLSRWPLRQAERIALPLVEAYDELTRYFYLKRNILLVHLEVPGHPGPLAVACTHAEAFSPDDTRRRHLERFVALLDGLDRQGVRFVAGGDLNVVPPGSRQTRGFADEASEEFDAGDLGRDSAALMPLYERYEPAIALERYTGDNAPHFSHSTSGGVFWNRKLDYLFTNGRFAPGSGLVHQDETGGGVATMPLSDHAPVTARLVW